MDADERIRRLRAAQAYRGLDRKDMAQVLNISASLLDEKLGKRKNRTSEIKDSELQLAAEKLELPLAFFFGEFDVMRNGLRADTPETMRRYIAAEPRVTPTAAEREAARAREAAALRERARRTSEHPGDDRGTSDARRGPRARES